jgi:hypothetical protein
MPTEQGQPEVDASDLSGAIQAPEPVAETSGQSGETPKADTPSIDQYVVKEGKFAGKSAAEIAKSYDELESRLGRQAQEVGELRGAIDLLTRVGQAQQQQAAPPMNTNFGAPPEAPSKFNWDNPEESVSRLASAQAQAIVRNELGQFARAFQYQQAMNSAGLAEQSARNGNPGLFKGVEDKVKVFMNKGVQSGLINPTAVTNPETWNMAAWVLKGQESNWGNRAPVNPVSPSATERPNAGGQRDYGEEAVNFDDNIKAGIKIWENATGSKVNLDKMGKEIATERKRRDV